MKTAKFFVVTEDGRSRWEIIPREGCEIEAEVVMKDFKSLEDLFWWLDKQKGYILFEDIPPELVLLITSDEYSLEELRSPTKVGIISQGKIVWLIDNSLYAILRRREEQKNDT
jgi:hypothetical protein